MNERIKEVWIKAAREDSDPDRWDTQEQFIERFALLIVRECCRALWTEECHTSDLASEEYTRGSKKIKQHFGIEE